jgi:hypothetical protein
MYEGKYSLLRLLQPAIKAQPRTATSRHLLPLHNLHSPMGVKYCLGSFELILALLCKILV